MLVRDDDVAVEAVWTGVPEGELGPLKAGETLRVFTAHFLTFREGEIAAQRTNSCVEAPTP